MTNDQARIGAELLSKLADLSAARDRIGLLLGDKAKAKLLMTSATFEVGEEGDVVALRGKMLSPEVISAMAQAIDDGFAADEKATRAALEAL